MTALCVNCNDRGILLPSSIDPEERICPYIRDGVWKWLGRVWDPDGTWEKDTSAICGNTWAAFSRSKQTLLNKHATLTNSRVNIWDTVEGCDHSQQWK